MNFAARILVLIGAVVLASSGGECFAQAKDSPAAAPTKDIAPTKDAPSKDALTKGTPVKDASDGKADTKDAKSDAKTDGKSDAKTDGKTDAPNKPVTDTPAITPSPPAPAPVPPLYQVVQAEESAVTVLGSVDPAQHDIEVVLNPVGAGVYQVRFSRYRQNVDLDDPYQITGPITKPGGNIEPPFEPAMTAWAVVVNNFNLNLFDKKWSKVKEGVYAITVADTAGNPVLRITRTYTLDGYQLKCRTVFDNLSGKPLEVVWRQNAIGDVPKESDYRGDARQVMVGYHDMEYDAKRVHVYTDEGTFTREAMLDEYEEKIAEGKATELEWLVDQRPVKPGELDLITKAPPFWPSEDAPANEVVWLASINRYFTSIIYRPLEDVTDENVEATVALPLDDIFQSEMGISKDGATRGRVDERRITFTLTSKPFTIDPGASHEITLAVYNGPRQSELLASLPVYRVLEFEDHLVKYELGCTLCLFQGLADFLLGFLKLLHMIVSDWGIAIIILVICVRILLHPLTKKAQVSMSVMGKQMAAIQPEMAKIKEKYKNDSQKQQQEMMKLYREKGINPLGFLGCLPMFLQMPIWMALYAMLWGAIELRHEPGFFGVFQAINPDWAFLADLSSYDMFIDFESAGFDLPICGMHIPGALNILPILMAIMFYLQQKLMAPEATTDQQKQQQKMMKFMVFIFPIMLYAAPSGLTLYILASSTAGMIDSYYVRKHIKRMEEDGTLFKKKERKPGGFMDRLGTMVQEKQKQIQARDQALQGAKGSKGGGGGRRGGKSKKRK